MTKPAELARTLTLRDLLGVVMGAIIGVGIFFQPKTVMDIAGARDVALAAWLLGGLIAMMGSLTFAELGTLFPKTGGHYLILRESYGRPVGFLYCWSLLCVIQSGAIAIIAIIFVNFCSSFLGVEPSEPSRRAWSILVVAALTTANILGVRRGAAIAGMTTLLKVLILGAVIFVGLLFDAESALPTGKPPTGDGSWGLLVPALIPVLFAYGGWQQGTYLAGEVKEPGRVLPRGIIGGVLGVAALYLMFNVALTGLMTPEQMTSTEVPVAEAMASALGEVFGRITSLAIAVSAFGVASVCIMTAPRMYKAIADDGCFFPAVGRVSPRFGTPAVALGLQGAIPILMIAIVGADRIDYMTTGVVCIDWVFFLLTGLALFILRKRRPDAERPYRAWGYPLVPALFVVFAGVAIVGTFVLEKYRSASLVAVAVMTAGCAAYLLFVRRRS